MSDGWNLAKSNFTDDDGSLPEIVFAGLAAESLRGLVDYFRQHGTISEIATLYDNASQTDVLLMNVDDPASRVLSGTADSFHCCFSGISHGGVEIPVLGLFVFRDSVEIDYRMGVKWTPSNVDALFRLFAQLKSLAPEAEVRSAENEGPPYPDEFMIAFNRYAEVQGLQPR